MFVGAVAFGEAYPGTRPLIYSDVFRLFWGERLGAHAAMKELVLGLVIDRPGYGYELNQRIEEQFSFLGLSRAFVYSALESLERSGFIEPVGPKAAGRTRRGSPRVMYRPTEDGVREFGLWMGTPTDLPRVRESAHVKLLLARSEAELRDLLDHLHRLHRQCVNELNALGDCPPVHELTDDAMPWPAAAALLVEDARATQIRACSDWLDRACEVVEERLDALEAAERRGAPPHPGRDARATA